MISAGISQSQQEEERFRNDAKYADTLPTYDASLGTRTGCVVATAIGAAAATACLIGGAVVLATHPQDLIATYIVVSYKAVEALSFFINFGLTLCLDNMMFAHSVSLRWALFHEQRLSFNTNLRLFNSSRKFGPNSLVPTVSSSTP